MKLVFCQFEPSRQGYCINSLVEELIEFGYSKDDLNKKLERQGLEARKSARNRCYDLHAMIIYDVDEDFPAIRESSFVTGMLPKGVESITYTVSLDGISGNKIV